jgi:ectoine hydroxylase-related dioxygenase (phytanoyl-CoA dioxygenase family)
MFLLPIESENYNTYKTFSLRPIEGHLVIFRSNLKHMVEKNISNESRISIAMNFIVKETL